MCLSFTLSDQSAGKRPGASAIRARQVHMPLHLVRNDLYGMIVIIPVQVRKDRGVEGDAHCLPTIQGKAASR